MFYRQHYVICLYILSLQYYLLSLYVLLLHTVEVVHVFMDVRVTRVCNDVNLLFCFGPEALCYKWIPSHLILNQISVIFKIIFILILIIRLTACFTSVIYVWCIKALQNLSTIRSEIRTWTQTIIVPNETEKPVNLTPLSAIVDHLQ